MNGVERIAKERQRQVDRKGWTAEHDTGHHFDQLARAAAVYALPEKDRQIPLGHGTLSSLIWPCEYVVNGRGEPHSIYERWQLEFGDRIRELEKAGALVAAEIDRLLAITEE